MVSSSLLPAWRRCHCTENSSLGYQKYFAEVRTGPMLFPDTQCRPAVQLSQLHKAAPCRAPLQPDSPVAIKVLWHIR